MSNENYIENILEKYGFEGIKKTSNGFMARCKWHDDKNPSFSINLEGLWTCFSCQISGNLKQLIEKLGGDPSDYLNSLETLSMQLTNSNYKIVPAKINKVNNNIYEPYENISKVPKYLLNRLSWEAIEFFKLGESENIENRIFVPIFYKNKMIAYNARAIDNLVAPKYLNTVNFNLKDYVFNYDNCIPNEELFIVEGAFNAMSMWEKGFKNVIATFGVIVSNAQIEKIFKLSPSSITICFDRDSKSRSGQKAALNLAERINEFITVDIMILLKDKDPNVLSQKVLNLCYSKKVCYNESNKDKNN